MTVTPVALGLGSNKGRRKARLEAAIEDLGGSLVDLRVGGLYESEAVSPVRQPPFLNTAVVGDTELSPEQLLAVAKALELDAGRMREGRWGPRPLDIDILIYGNLVRSDAELVLPHPCLRRREFALRPLADVAPDLEVPPDSIRVRTLLAKLPEAEAVVEVGWSREG